MELITLTRPQSLKRPSQIMRLNNQILYELDSLAGKLSKAGFVVVWDDSPKCILTKLECDSKVYYCCAVREMVESTRAKLENNKIKIFDNGTYSVIILSENSQKAALEKLYSITGRIPIL